MHGLEEQFGEEIAFVWLNVDNPDSRPLREQFDIVPSLLSVLVKQLQLSNGRLLISLLAVKGDRDRIGFMRRLTVIILEKYNWCQIITGKSIGNEPEN